MAWWLLGRWRWSEKLRRRFQAQTLYRWRQRQQGILMERWCQLVHEKCISQQLWWSCRSQFWPLSRSSPSKSHIYCTPISSFLVVETCWYLIHIPNCCSTLPKTCWPIVVRLFLANLQPREISQTSEKSTTSLIQQAQNLGARDGRWFRHLQGPGSVEFFNHGELPSLS